MPIPPRLTDCFGRMLRYPSAMCHWVIGVLPVRGVPLGTAGRVAVFVVGRWGLLVSSSEGFPQLVERARDVRRAIREILEEVPQPLEHETRLTRMPEMCRLEVIGSMFAVTREPRGRQPAPS